MSGMLAFAAGGLAKGLGDGAMLVGKDRMEAAQKALEEQAATGRTQMQIDAAKTDTQAQIAGRSADTQAEIASKEKVAGIEQSGAAARGMMAYSNITTDDTTGNKYLVSPDGKTVTPLVDPTTKKPLTGATNTVKDNPEKAVYDAFKQAAASTPVGEDVDYDAVKTQLDLTGIKYDPQIIARAKAAAQAAKAAKEAADPKNQPGIFSRTFDAIFGGNKPTTGNIPQDTSSSASPDLESASGTTSMSGSKYKTADEVKADYAAGKIPKNKATQILQDQFGYE